MPVEQVTDTRTNVIATIRRVAQTQQADFDYLLTQAKVESGLNPTARAQTSSAAGLYQFTAGTWLDVVRRHGDKAGLDGQAQALRSDTLTNQQRASLLDLRNQPEIATTMAAHLAADNARALSAAGHTNLGGTELYLAHFLGAGGAKTFLDGLRTSPAQPAAPALPSAAAANTPIFYENGRARSFQEIYTRFSQKFGGTSTTMAAATPPAFSASLAATSDAARLPTRFQSVQTQIVADPQSARIAAAVRSALSPDQSSAGSTGTNATQATSSVAVSEEAMSNFLRNFELVDHSTGLTSPGTHSLRDASQAADVQDLNQTSAAPPASQLAIGANLVLKAVDPNS